jgi:hypothetical protein
VAQLFSLGIVRIMKTFVTFLTAALIICSFSTASFAAGSVDDNLTKQISSETSGGHSALPHSDLRLQPWARRLNSLR